MCIRDSYGASAITAITAQNTRGVIAVAAVSPAMVAAQIDAVFGDLDVRAVKIGMLGNADVIATVADRLAAILAAHPVPVVLDPVMLQKWADNHGHGALSYAELSRRPEVRASNRQRAKVMSSAPMVFSSTRTTRRALSRSLIGSLRPSSGVIT